MGEGRRRIERQKAISEGFVPEPGIKEETSVGESVAGKSVLPESKIEGSGDEACLFDEGKPITEKPEKKRSHAAEAVFACFILFLIIQGLLPRPLSYLLPGFDPEQVASCEVIYDYYEVSDGERRSWYQQRSIDPDTEDFEELIDLLEGKLYRKQISSIIANGPNSHSITLNPHGKIYFRQGNGPYVTYEIGFYGKDIYAGRSFNLGEKHDYSLWGFGTREFQEEVVAFLGAHGTLIKEEETVIPVSY